MKNFKRALGHVSLIMTLGFLGLLLTSRQVMGQG